MSRRTVVRNDFFAALVVILLGIFSAWQSSYYSFGTVSRIGPGMFPLALGVILIIAGCGIMMIESRLGKGSAIRSFPARGIFSISVAILAFAFLIERVGLAPAVFAAVFFSALAEREFRIKRVFVLAIALAAVCSLIFTVLLGLQVRPLQWRW